MVACQRGASAGAIALDSAGFGALVTTIWSRRFSVRVVVPGEAVELDDHAAGAAGQELALERLVRRRVLLGDIGAGFGVAVSARDQ